MELRNNTILITGGTSGFGYEFARQLLGLGPLPVLGAHHRPLPLELRGELRVHVLEHLVRVVGGLLGEVRAHRLAVPLALLVDLGLHGRVERAEGGEVPAEPVDRVALLPVVDLCGLPVAAGVVGVGVRLHPVGDRLHQGGAAAFAGLGDRGGEHRVQRDQVVAVDAHAGQAVADGLVRQVCRVRLLVQRHGDRVLVVLHQEHHRSLVDGGAVAGLVEVALAGGAVAEEAQGDARVPGQFRGEPEADGVRALGGQRRALRHGAPLLGVVAAVPGAAQQGERVDGRDAAQHEGGGVAVGRQQPVLLGERVHGGDLAGLLAAAGRVDREAALHDQVGRLGVEGAREAQRAVAAQQRGGLEDLRVRTNPALDGGAVFVQVAQGRTVPRGAARLGSLGALGVRGQVQQRHGVSIGCSSGSSYRRPGFGRRCLAYRPKVRSVALPVWPGAAPLVQSVDIGLAPHCGREHPANVR